MSEDTIVATPNPVFANEGAEFGETVLTWRSEGAETVEVRVGAYNGPLFARSGDSGRQATGKWVQDGTCFYLQDVSHGLLLSPAHTLATVTVRVMPDSCADEFSREEELWAFLERKVDEYGFAEPKRSTWLRFNADLRRGERVLSEALSALALNPARNLRILDIGCGFGGLLRAIAHRFGDGYGVEVLLDRALWSQRRSPKAAVVCADVSALPWTSDRFDLVLSTGVFEHIDFTHQQAAASEIFRVLAPGGLAYFTVPNRFQRFDEHNYVWFGTWLPPSLRAWYVRKLSASGDYLQCWERSAKGWRRLFEREGFQVEVRSTRSGRWRTADSFQLIIRKPHR